MPILIALRSLTGDYGTVHEGQTFDATEAQAESLESRGLACRYYPPIAPRRTYDTKVIVAADPQKAQTLPSKSRK